MKEEEMVPTIDDQQQLGRRNECNANQVSITTTTLILHILGFPRCSHQHAAAGAATTNKNSNNNNISRLGNY